MRIRHTAGWVAGLVLVLAGRPAGASVAGNALAPMGYGHWDWEQRPLAGNVARIQPGREALDEKTGQVVERLMQPSRFDPGPDNGRVETIGLEQRPIARRFFDASGRLARVEGQMMDGGTRQTFTYALVLTYDAAGNVEAAESLRDGQSVGKLTGKTEPLPGGGRRTRLTGTTEPGRAVEYVYEFDAKGGMTRSQSHPKAPAFILTRNDRGDVASFRMGEKGALTEFEYRYDEQVNWVRRETFRTDQGKRTSTMVEFRRITYGGAVAAGPAATRPASGPAATAPVNVNKDALVGVYESELGKAGEGFHSLTRIELKAEGKLRYIQKDTLRDQLFDKEAEGTWAIEGGKVMMRLQKAVKGPAIPADFPPLPATPGADGKSLVGPDGKRVFKRVQ